jgi:hypothetical protein
MGPRLLEMKFYGIDQVHLISPLCEPKSVNTGSAPDIKNNRGRWRKLASEDRMSAKSLQLALAR